MLRAAVSVLVVGVSSLVPVAMMKALSAFMWNTPPLTLESLPYLFISTPQMPVANKQ